MTDLATSGTPAGPVDSPAIEGHCGEHAVAVAAAHGVETMFTLSGAHVFPMYDGAVHAEPPMRLLDVRHEQTAVFAAEAVGKLTRRPGLAVLTAGPGVTNGISAVTQAKFSGVPLVVVGGRAADNRWGSGSLQELDHVPLLSAVTKQARTVHRPDQVADAVHDAFQVARTPHRGPTFLDVPLDVFFDRATVTRPTVELPTAATPDPDALSAIGALLAAAERPVLLLGSDVWLDGAAGAALSFVERLGVPAITNGMARGVVPGRHPLLVSKARGVALGQCDLAVVVGTPLDFRVGYGAFGGKEGTPAAKVVHIADSPNGVATHVELTASAAGDLTLALDGIADAWEKQPRHADWAPWVTRLQEAAAATSKEDQALLRAEADPIHPGRIYGELLPRLADDAVVIGDGGDFVSFAGRFVEPARPGCWLDPGPFGCLGAGLGAAIGARLSRPSAQVVLLLGDGAAGMSLMDADTLVRHRLPVVMVVGNNGAWGLEKGPMQMLYGYDVVADLAPQTRYDRVVTALGGAGETVTDPSQVGAALDRAFDAGLPYLVNVITDVTAAYPRKTFGN